MKVSDMLLATFGGKGAGYWAVVNGRGRWIVPPDGQASAPPPDWLDWPKHTAADMGPKDWREIDQPARVQVRNARRGRRG